MRKPWVYGAVSNTLFGARMRILRGIFLDVWLKGCRLLHLAKMVPKMVPPQFHERPHQTRVRHSGGASAKTAGLLQRQIRLGAVGLSEALHAHDEGAEPWPGR